MNAVPRKTFFNGFVLLVIFVSGMLFASPTAAQEPLLNPCTQEPYVTLLTNASILKASSLLGPAGDWQVQIELVSDQNTRAFTQFTETHLGQVAPVTLDGVVKMVPIVRDRLENMIVLSGNFSAEEVKEIIAVISTEPLPVALSYDSIAVSKLGARIGFSIPESVGAEVVGRVITIMERRLSVLKVSGALVFGVGTHQISLDLPADYYTDVVIPAMLRPGLLEVVDGSIPEGCTAEALKPGQEILTTEGQKRSR